VVLVRNAVWALSIADATGETPAILDGWKNLVLNLLSSTEYRRRSLCQKKSKDIFPLLVVAIHRAPEIRQIIVR
jgi:hypothetical protein